MSSSRPSAVVSSARAARRSAIETSIVCPGARPWNAAPNPGERVLRPRQDRRSLGRHADHVKERHATGRSGSRGERLELILRRRDDHAVDDGNRVAGKLAHQVPEHSEELIVLLQRGRDAGQAQEHLSRTLRGQVQSNRRHSAGDRAADVEQVGIAFCPRADHRVGEGDRIRLTPRDLLPELRPHVRLVRRARPGRHRAHAFVGEHLPRRLRRPLGRDRPVLPAALVDTADVEAGWHRDLRAERGEMLRELERRITEVDGAVDVRLRDVHQRIGAVDVGHPHEDRHRQLCGGPPLAIQHRPIGTGQGQHSSSL